MYLLLAYRRALDGRTALLLAALMLMSAPVNLNFYWGQSQLIILALMAAAMRAMDRNRDGTAGLMIAIAALLRAYPLLLVGYFIFRRKWRAVIIRDGGNRSWRICDRRDFRSVADSQLRSRRIMAH